MNIICWQPLKVFLENHPSGDVGDRLSAIVK